ncbi:hypothetical protein WJX73_007552 [Symbiochloris irregularis]|uniref:Galactokinase n=1 Tax=Symbiochloris irregularis TaxID=706552 RepID=A0AAW1NSP9_9CHLO
MAEVPVFDNLKAVYGEAGESHAKTRYSRLEAAFKKRFGTAPDLYARSPGRVNLIGEHIDYEGYGVLPMAIKQDTIVACRRHGSELVVANINPDKYKEYKFSTDPEQNVDAENHSWANYFLAAYKGVFEHLQSKGGQVPEPVGLELIVDGTVPEGSGLSSSAALVCSSSLAILAALGTPCSQHEVATFTAVCEKYVGTESGGMDQAISIMGAQDIAKLVEFNPVRAEDVVLPKGATFVIANSLTVSAKAETAAARYNMRVVECRLAAMLLALKLGESKESAHKIKTLREVETLLQKHVSGPKGDVSNANAAVVEEHLHEDPYNTEELEKKLGAPLKKLFAGNSSQLRVLEIAESAGGYKLRQRALHVYAEAQRVPQFRDVCNGSASADEKLAQLAQLMDDSQTSCRELYECSCAELDTLIKLSKESGALAGRLTGAGWGGCMVALVPDAQAQHVIEHLKKEYFAGFVEKGKLGKDEAFMSAVVFASRPSSGGAILKLKHL